MLLAPAASPWQSPEVPGTDRFQRPLQGRPSLTGGHSVAGANPRRQARHSFGSPADLAQAGGRERRSDNRRFGQSLAFGSFGAVVTSGSRTVVRY